MTPVAIRGNAFPSPTATPGQVLTTNGSGTLSWQTPASTYTLPVATSSVLGGVKQGTNITIAADGTISSTGGGLTQTDADARYVNITGDTMTGGLTTTSITAGPARSVFSANNEQYGIGVRYAPAGGPVYFGAASASATPDAVISGAGGSALMTLTNVGTVGFGASPTAQLTIGYDGDRAINRSSNTGSLGLIGGPSFAGATGAAALFLRGGESTYNGGGLEFYTNGEERIRVLDNGNVGIGPNAAPAATLDVNGTALIRGNATFQGTTNTFPARSINNNAVAFATPKQINVAAYTVLAADAGTIIWNVHTAADAFINLPTDAEAAIPVGATIRIMADTTRLTYIRPNAGASLFWQASSSGSFPDNSTRQGGSGPTFATRPLGRLSLTQVVKVAANTWYHFPN
jgi:hypothetical protein